MSKIQYKDLRDWLKVVEDTGELKTVEGATWQEDIGMATELLNHTPQAPAALFDSIPGYPKGFRVLTNFFVHSTEQGLLLEAAYAPVE